MLACIYSGVKLKPSIHIWILRMAQTVRYDVGVHTLTIQVADKLPYQHWGSKDYLDTSH